MFKGLGNIATLMRQAQHMGGRMNSIQEQLKTQRVQGNSGGGMVEVETNGIGEVLRVKIDPTLVERGECEMIEDLIPAAMNQAMGKARELHAEALKSLTDGVDIPGLTDALENFTNGSSNTP